MQIQALVARLDEQSTDNSIQVRLRPLERVVAEQMAKMLQSIYPQMSQGTLRVVEKLDPFKPALTNAPPATRTTNAVVFTDAAARKVGELIREEGNPKLKLRVFVSGGGCSGFQYGFTFDEKIVEGDHSDPEL